MGQRLILIFFNAAVLSFLFQKVKFILERVTKAQKGRRSTDNSFFNLGARWGWVVKNYNR